MSGIKPFFLTGDKLKIKLNGKTIAFATDLSCSIQITHQTPHILGMYEGVSVEPLAYNVSGSFSIIRYVRHAAKNIGGTPPHSVNANIDSGNGAGNWGSTWGGGVLNNVLGNPFAKGGSDGRANEALDPSTYSQGTTFDIEVYQKFAQEFNNEDSEGNLLGVIKIRSVRITKADFSIGKKSPGMDKFDFVALYVDGDAYVANPSGKGQQNT